MFLLKTLGFLMALNDEQYMNSTFFFFILFRVVRSVNFGENVCQSHFTTGQTLRPSFTPIRCLIDSNIFANVHFASDYYVEAILCPPPIYYV